jgi:SPP1 gp7 family putative phage head morphogenesis protein
MVDLKLARVPFKDAVDFLKNKVPLGTEAWSDLLNEAHDRAFVIAGVTRGDVLTDIQNSIAKAMNDGTPLDQWRKKEFPKIIEGRWIPTDKRTGEANAGWRARVIFETNMRTAYAAGRHAEFQRMRDAFPYWQYRHGDSRVARPDHLSWDGMVLRADDPWWETHYPPNGFGCRCFVRPVSESALKRLGKEGPDAPPPSPMRQVKYGDRMIEVPQGVDPGWAYTPGASLESKAQVLERQLDRMRPDIAERVKKELASGHRKTIDEQLDEQERLAVRAKAIEERIAKLPPEIAEKVKAEIAKLPQAMDPEKRLDEAEGLVGKAEEQTQKKDSDAPAPVPEAGRPPSGLPKSDTAPDLNTISDDDKKMLKERFAAVREQQQDAYLAECVKEVEDRAGSVLTKIKTEAQRQHPGATFSPVKIIDDAEMDKIQKKGSNWSACSGYNAKTNSFDIKFRRSYVERMMDDDAKGKKRILDDNYGYYATIARDGQGEITSVKFAEVSGKTRMLETTTHEMTHYTHHHHKESFDRQRSELCEAALPEMKGLTRIEKPDIALRPGVQTKPEGYRAWQRKKNHIELYSKPWDEVGSWLQKNQT